MRMRAGRMKFLLFPLLIITMISGSILFIWGGSMFYAGLEAQHDASLFAHGNNTELMWVDYGDLDSRLTGQGEAYALYNYGIELVHEALQEKNINKIEMNLVLANYSFSDAYIEAEKANDTYLLAHSASALGAIYIVIALIRQDASFFEKADVMLVKAITLNPDDIDAKWNLEFLRRMYSEGDGQKPGEPDDDGIPQGPSKLDPGKGGL